MELSNNTTQAEKQPLVKLNLGCGIRKKEGMINVDISEGCGAQVIHDLTNSTWPWADSSVGEVHFDFSLEQMGETKKDLLHVLKELYRVCANDAKIFIKYSHPNHDQFVLNPLNVHRLSPQFFQLLSMSGNMQLIAVGSQETMLALMLSVNFQVTRFKYLLSAEFESQFSASIDKEDVQKQLRTRMKFENNICQGVEVDMVAIKPEIGLA